MYVMWALAQFVEFHTNVEQAVETAGVLSLIVSLPVAMTYTVFVIRLKRVKR